MASEPQADRMVIPAHGDLIRIVPLHVPKNLTDQMADIPGAPPATPPHLSFRSGSGAMLSSVKVYTIFWGAAWQGAQAQMVTDINAFFDAILTGPLMTQLAEYNTGGYTVGQGQRIGTTTITTPHLGHTVTDNGIQHMLQHEIATNHAIPQPTLSTLYFVYLPPGVSVVQGGSRSCQAFCGYHSDINSQIFYAAMPFPGCNGCTGNLSQLDALTSTSSHELCEAITDAVPGNGWYDDTNGEIGDICAWQTKKIGNYTVQLEWSNQQNKCM
jgi:hypothetical protein